ncbi:Na/Pi symporter [Bacillus sp. JJ634]
MYNLFLFLLFIGIFLAGMAVLRMGLFHLSGEALQALLLKLTNKPWKGFLTGIGFTGLLQSSSAVMVMTVGFVSAGSLTFPQTIGIILGTNIGSTFITEFLTFSLDSLIIPGLICGACLTCIPHLVLRSSGIAFIGLSAIFAAMSGFKYLSSPIASYPIVQTLLIEMKEHWIIGLLVGIVLTACIHSSSAVIGMAMSFLASGELSVSSAIIIMLGSNIGTCITGYMASIGSGKEASFTAYAHIWLNVLGVFAFLPLVNQLEQLAAYFTTDPATQLAHASVLFNVITSVIVLPFAKHFAKFILFLHHR